MSVAMYSERVVAGRREHQCTFCREPIAKGARHVYVTIYAGDWRSHRAHVDCQAAAQGTPSPSGDVSSALAEPDQAANAGDRDAARSDAAGLSSEGDSLSTGCDWPICTCTKSSDCVAATRKAVHA